MAGTVGERIRVLREELGLSQARLVEGLNIVPAYISLIENGRRQPKERVLELLADRLGTTAEYLITGRGGRHENEMRLDLQFAELALSSGDAQDARVRFQQLLEQAQGLRYDDLRLAALWGRSRADEALGNLEEAIAGFLALADEDELPAAISRTAIMLVLAHGYSRSGEIDRAIEVGENALARARRTDPQMLDFDEVIELASTLVGCYYMRGHLTQAFVLVRQVIEDAERRGSPRARAAAYWNAGLVAEGRGDVGAALTYTEKALALYGETNNARASTLLRLNYAWLLLRTPDPDLAFTEELLHRVLDELAEVGSSVDVAAGETQLARCVLLSGRPQEAATIATAAIDRLFPQTRLETASARAVLGQAQLAMGEDDLALQSIGVAAEELSRVGADRHAAEIWLHLGDALSQLDRHEQAGVAYREAAAAAGVVTLPLHSRYPEQER